jgi:phosphatidylglycerol lysyltransferase
MMKEPIFLKFKKYAGYFLAMAITAAAIYAFSKVASEISLDDVFSGLKATHPASVIAALAMTFFCYFSLSGYDVIALRSLGKSMPFREILKGSISAYSLSHNIGFAPVTGTYARYKIYSRHDVSLADVARIMVLAGASFWLGIILILGISLVVFPGVLRLGEWEASYPLQVAIGLGVIDVIVIYYLLISTGRKSVGLGKISVPLPSLKDAIFQSGISLLEMILASAILWVLIPSSTFADYPFVLVAYVFAFVMVLVTHAPGGAGVLEAIILLMLPDLPGGEVVAALLLFRIVFHLLPLAVGFFVLLKAPKIENTNPSTSIMAGGKDTQNGESFVS